MQFSKSILPGILSLSLMAAAIASAQTLSIVSGDGQAAPQNFAAQFPMVVVVKNAQGQPQANVTVTWTIASGQGSLFVTRHLPPVTRPSSILQRRRITPPSGRCSEGVRKPTEGYGSLRKAMEGSGR